MAKAKNPQHPASGPRLTDGMKLALGIALNEVFVENVEAAVEDAHDLLHGGDLGATYQGFHRGVLDPAGVARHLRDLNLWVTSEHVAKLFASATPTSTVADVGCDLVDAVSLAAGIELAEAILRIAIDEQDFVPARTRPWLDVLAPYGARLAAKIEREDADEEPDLAGDLG